MFAPCYLDFNATTALDERVLAVMLPYLGARFGNASSRHEYGRHARQAIEQAREQVACAVGARAENVFFTSGGSEANNLFIKGWSVPGPGRAALSAGEHPCVGRAAEALRRQGWQIETLPLTTQGGVDVPEACARMRVLRPLWMSVMLAHNETGAINDVPALAEFARQHGIALHTDAVQALGKMPVDFRALGVQAMSVSAHKIHGPQGVGALILDKRLELQPLIAGGGQERGLRSGTENLAAIVGFGEACALLCAELPERIKKMSAVHQTLEAGLRQQGAQIFAQESVRLPNTSFFAFAGIDGETLVAKLDRAGFAVASGAACSSAQVEASPSLLAMGVEPALARCAVRVSVGACSTLTEITDFLQALGQTVQALQTLLVYFQPA